MVDEIPEHVVKTNPYKKDGDEVPFAMDSVDSGMYGSAAAVYGSTLGTTVKPKIAGAIIGDSNGGTPWATDNDAPPEAKPPSPVKRDTCPFATDLDN